MVQTAKSPSERLRELFETADDDPARKNFVGELTERVKKTLDTKAPTPDWFDFSTCARFALLAPDSRNPNEAPIAAAFEAAGLDFKNPFHWRQLISYFAWAHFGPKRGRGRPEIWNSERYGQLLQDVDRIKAKNVRLSDAAACTNLKKNNEFKARYEGQSAERLRKALREARNPYYNDELARLVDVDWWAQIEACQDRDERLSDEQEAAMIDRWSKHYSETIANRWRKT